MSGAPASYHMQDYHRPRTPGTPGTFDTGYSGNFQDNGAFASQYDPHNRALSPSPMPLDDQSHTYYFEKNGGAAAGAGAGAGAGAAGAGAGAAARGSAAKGGFVGWVKRHPVWTSLIALAIVAAVVGAAVGGGVAGSSKTTNDATTGSSKDSASGSGNSGTSSGGSSSNGGSNPGTTQKTITPLPKWNLTDPESKMIGVSMGNWLVLERWLDEDWFTGLAGPEAWDEWDFTKNLGADKAKTELTTHWNSFVQESDIDKLKSVGVNTVRIPLGYWAFVDTAKGEPYLSKAGQTDQLQKMLGWLYDRQMYAMIDLHGMPGSQNGDQSSGHNTSNIAWFDNDNFGYSYTVLNATIDWIKQSNYSSVVHSVCPVNEPRPGTDSGRLSQLTSFYETSYQLLKNAGLIMMFHHGFLNNPYDQWSTFASGKDPNYLSFNSNPYPGWFPPQSDGDSIVSKVCQEASQAAAFPVPVVMTEYSIVNNVNSKTFNQHYYNTEVSAWAWSGGSVFWTFKAAHSSNPVQAVQSNIMDLYSFTTLIDQGIIAPSDANAKPLDMIKSLSNQQCGNIPTVSWSNPSGTTKSSKKRSNSRRAHPKQLA